MSDDFIPLNQSTPVGERWEGGNNQMYQNQFQNRNQGGQRRGYGQRRGNSSHHNSWNNSPRNNSWGNHSSRNNSYGSDSNNSFSNDKSNIDAYLHPSMLQDPWAQLRRKLSDPKQLT